MAIPALDNFDFASIKRDWSHRFFDLRRSENAEGRGHSLPMVRQFCGRSLGSLRQ